MSFEELVCRVVASTAANLGGLEGALGRPGSWEAENVRQLVLSAVPEDELLGLRTEPVRLILDPAEVFVDLGIARLYWDVDEALNDEECDLAARDLPEEDYDQLADELQARRELLDELYEADQASYFDAYVVNVRRAAARRGVTVEVHVERVSDGSADPWSELASELHEEARERTPLPLSGRPLSEYPSTDSPGNIDRAAGLTYLARLDEAVANPDLNQSGGRADA